VRVCQHQLLSCDTVYPISQNFLNFEAMAPLAQQFSYLAINTVRERNPASITLHKTIIPANRNKCHVSGISTTPCGSRKKFPIHANKLPSRNIAIHANPCKHFITTHVLSFSFCRMSFLSKHVQNLGLKSLNTLCRHRMKQDIR